MEQQPPHPNPADAGAAGTIRRRPHMKRNGSYPNLLASADSPEVTEARPSRSRHAQTRPRAEHVHHHHHPVCTYSCGVAYRSSVIFTVRLESQKK